MIRLCLICAAALANGCSAKVEIEDRRANYQQTAEIVSSEAEESRISVEITAGGERQPPQSTVLVPAHQRSRTTGVSDDRLLGKWRIIEGDVDGTVQFTPGGHVLFVWYHRGLGRDWTQTGSYGWTGPATIKIEESGNYGSESTREVEFLSGDELLITKPSGYGFTWLFGRLERVE